MTIKLDNFAGVTIAVWLLMGIAANAFLTWIFAVNVVKCFIFTVRAIREKRARDRNVSP